VRDHEQRELRGERPVADRRWRDAPVAASSAATRPWMTTDSTALWISA